MAQGLKPKSTILSLKDQLFLTLIKLRLNKEDYAISLDFNITRKTVSNIFTTWINFLYLEFKETNFWLSREIIDTYFPQHFKHLFPTTRVVLDATEVAITKPSNTSNQRSSFSTYKNQNTLKVLVGVAPRGQVTYVSDVYCGATSDRQIVERSTLVSEPLLSSGDAIMADRGIMVQDLFIGKNVTVNTPTTMRGVNQLPPGIVVHDRRIASKRIHVERVIGYAKTYKILNGPICSERRELASRIVPVCLYLVNFRDSIVGAIA